VTASSTSPSTVAAYPLPRPACDDDPRFTYGLVLDIADVLTGHGYPRPVDTDWADLMLALFRFLYQPPPAQKGDQ
jgi:hypothetical protein